MRVFTAFIVIASLLLGASILSLAPIPFSNLLSRQAVMAAVLGDEDEDDEDEEEDEEEDDEEEEEEDTPTKAPANTTPAIRYRTVTKTIIVTEPGYDRDSDGDVVVDALDPDPERHQREYFTDTDEDGVPNALDRYHDEDDFAYFESATDRDNDGLIDHFERE